MLRLALLAVLVISSGSVCNGQINYASGTSIAKDTSFTVHSAWQKALKTHPNISIAKGGGRSSVILEKENYVYCIRATGSLHADIFHEIGGSEKKRPTVLLIHGGGWRSGDKNQQAQMARALAASGFVAIAVEYRLAAVAKYPAAVHDIKAAIRWTKAEATRFGIDTNKIAILGCSAGGQLAALAGTTNGIASLEDNNCYASHSSSVQAIVDIDGILAFIHPESGEGDDSKNISAATYWFGYSKTDKPALWNEASPLNHVDSNTPPILFINSSVARMHAGRDDMIRKLDSLKIYHEVHTFPDAPHTFWFFNPWFDPTINYTVEFLNKVFGK